MRELAFLNSGVTIMLADKRGVETKEVTLHYEGGLKAFVQYLDRAKNALIPAPIMIESEREGITVEVALTWNDSYHEKHAGLHQQHPPARRRHPSGRFPRGADARRHEICRRHAGGEKGQDGADRRRLPRGADLRAFGEGAGSEILAHRPKTSSSRPKCVPSSKAW